MAGNIAEWTTEHCTNYNVVRGGFFGVGWDEFPITAGSRYGNSTLDSKVQNGSVTPPIGFRATLQLTGNNVEIMPTVTATTGIPMISEGEQHDVKDYFVITPRNS